MADHRHKVEQALSAGSQATSLEMVEACIRTLRVLLLQAPIEDTESEKKQRDTTDSSITLRGRAWKALLRLERVDAAQYLEMLDKGRSRLYDKIKLDTCRTFKNDKEFQTRVSEDRLIRVLNCFVNDVAASETSPFGYVQGMNIHLAPFIYIMPELDAYACFKRFETQVCPAYVGPTLAGVTVACGLLDEVMEIVDPELRDYLLGKKLTSVLIAFRYLLTFCACIPPLSEVLKLWDVFVAYGFHLNVLSVAAILINMREELFAASQPMALLREIDRLDAAPTIKTTLELLKKIPTSLYERIIAHITAPPK